MLRQRLQTSHVEMGGHNERREMSFKIGVERSRTPKIEMNNLDQKTYFHPCRRRKG